MKMKFVIPLGLVVLCGLCVAIVCISRQKAVEPPRAPLDKAPLPDDARIPTEVKGPYRSLTRAELGKRPSDRFTLEELEVLGQLPSAPSTEELKLAEKTSWWGSPLDPVTYWKDRPVWHDPTERSATDRGRQCPPIPFDDPSFRQCSTQDWQLNGSATPEGYTPRYVSNDYEQNFWSKWARLLPRPPKMIDAEQLRAAKSIMSSELRSRQAKQRGRPITAVDVERYWETVGRSAIADGSPPEAFSRSAIYAAFVLSVYAKHGASASNELNSWRGIVPNEYLDATESRLREMDKEWKRSYLNRIENELSKNPQLAPFMERYIKAYSDAWAL